MSINPDLVRAMIRDSSELNVLLNNEEQFSDDDISLFEEMIKGEIEIYFPALLGKKLPQLLGIYGILDKLLASEGHKENRNQMHISDDNVGTIDVSNKANTYFSLAGTYEAKFKGGCEALCARDFYRNMWGAQDSLSAENETATNWAW